MRPMTRGPEQTGVTENITFLKTRYAGGKYCMDCGTTRHVGHEISVNKCEKF